MRVAVLGAGGFLGRKLARQLAATGAELTLFDIQAPLTPDGSSATCIAGDIATLPDAAIPPGTEIVFHLAAVVSAAAEADYPLGRRVNVRGTEAVIDTCARLARPPRVVFTSSIASFSARPGEVLTDDTRQIPANSYGAQKAAAELFLNDASRRGMLDAVCLRLPTILVRPGLPNRAASSFVSGIVREPMLGERTTLPVPDDVALWVASPARALDWRLHAARLDTSGMGVDRSLNLPGRTVTPADILGALDVVAPGASALVERRIDQDVARIVTGWPGAFDPVRARGLGFSEQEPLLELIRAFAGDDLAETRNMRAALRKV